MEIAKRRSIKWTVISLIVLCVIGLVILRAIDATREIELSEKREKLISLLSTWGFGALLLAEAAALAVAVAKKLPMQRVFLLLYVPLSLAMMLVLPIGKVPDEAMHLDRAYAISTGQLVPTGANGGMFSMPDNLQDGWGEAQATFFDLRDMRDDLHVDSPVMRDLPANTGIYPVNNYFPQALGMAAARLFTHKRIVILYAARLSAWLTGLLLLYYAVSVIPFGKAVVVAASLFPMALQETMSAAADGITFACVLAFVAFILRAQTERRKLSRLSLLWLGLLTFGVVTLKVLYCPFALLLFALPEACFASKKTRAQYTAATLLLSFAILAGWVLFCKNAYADSGTSELAGNILIQAAYMLRYPLEFPKGWILSWYEDGAFYLLSMVGHKLAWFDIDIQTSLIFAVIAAFSCVAGNEKASLRIDADAATRRMGRLLLAASCASMLIVFLGLYLWWTPVGKSGIDDVQGRYFLPFLAPALCGAFMLADSRSGGDAPCVERTIPALPLAVIVLADVCVLSTVLQAIL